MIEPPEDPLDRYKPNRLSFLSWLEQMSALVTDGLHYASGPFDLDRYGQLRELILQAQEHWGPDAVTEALAAAMTDRDGYWTPKIEVRVGVRSDNMILMVREQDDRGWSLPGGWLDLGLRPEEGARKELVEETGIDVDSLRLVAADEQGALGCVPGLPFHVVKMVFVADLPHMPRPKPRHGHEILEAAWKPMATLNRLQLSEKRVSLQILHIVSSASTQLTLF